MNKFLLFIAFNAALLWLPAPARADDKPKLIVVVGAEGTPEFGEQFRAWAQRWQKAAETAQTPCQVIGVEEVGEKPDRDVLAAALQSHAGESKEPLWLVLIGHGTFDGKTARYNLRGPDITPVDLQGWLKAVERPLAIIDCTSCSGPFLAELSAGNRAIITATKTGHEYNFARFGDYLSQSIADPAADLDKDEQTSLLEGFLAASAKLREFYKSEGRLETESPLLDDNGDRLGTPAAWYQGLRPTKAAKSGAALDGPFASRLVLARSAREAELSPELREQRDALEQQLSSLRSKKTMLSEDDYLAELKTILVAIAKLYEQATPKSQ